MKLRYKVIIVLLVFAGALFVFSGGIHRTFFITGAQTTEVSGSTLPTVSIESDGLEVNRLFGYVSAIDEMTMRETITPLRSDRSFTVLISDNGSLVRKLKYEIYTEEGAEVESGSLTVLDAESGPKRAVITLSETMKSGKEYILKLTLITNKSKRIYYYTRLKMYEDAHLAEKVDFVRYFHDTLLSGSESERTSLKKYLETAKDADTSTYARLNIKSDYDMLNWGELRPTVIWEEIPEITEFYDAMASIRLKTLVSIKTEYGNELYLVKEDFRLNYTTLRVYLYNYERSMEALFDVAHTSIMKNEFKLGITSDTDAQTACSDSRAYAAFVHGRELYEYDTAKNTLIRVFSFRQDEIDYARGLNEDHAVRLLNISDSGDIDFVVYGYMDRGEYEGRVGIVLYRFYADECRIEERMYIPFNTTYRILNSEMAEFTYFSDRNVFYFGVFDRIYSYDLLTKELTVLAENVADDEMFFCREQRYLCWQEGTGRARGERIRVLHLESGEINDIMPTQGAFVTLFGRIDDNIVYGEADPADEYIYPDGSTLLPAYRLFIQSGEGRLLKEYGEDGIYISGTDIDGSMMVIRRMVKGNAYTNEYYATEPDSIMDKLEDRQAPVGVNKRVTDRTLTEYYVYLPSGVDIKTVPKQQEALGTVINFDTTVRIPEQEDRSNMFYVCSFGQVLLATSNAAEAVRAADAAVGTAMSGRGRVIWERGVKAARTTINGITPVDTDPLTTSVQAAMRMLLLYKNLDVDTTDFICTKETVYEYLSRKMVSTPLELTGITLDEALYYVYKERPVFAVGRSNGYLITAYNGTTVTYYDPARGKQTQAELEEAVKLFEDSGSIFVSYID